MTPCSRTDQARSIRCRNTLQSKGLTTPPCAAPVTGRRTLPSSITPARRIARTSRRTPWSHTRSSIACINLSCGIAVKQSAMSVSTTHRRPRQASSMTTCRASCGDRRGRNPKLHGRKSASKTGSSTIFTAACTMRSRTDGNRQRPPLGGSRLRDEHPTRRQRPIAAIFQFDGQLVEEPGNAVLLDIGQRGLVDARCPIIAEHRNPRPPQDILAEDFVSQRMESTSGISLGCPVERMLQGTDRIRRCGSRSGGTSRNDTHRAPPHNITHRRSSGPSLTDGSVVRSAQSVL